MKTLLIIFCLCSATAFAQKSASRASGLINCLGDRTVCTPPPPYSVPPGTAMRNASAPGAGAQEFVNGFANSFSITLSSSESEMKQIASMSSSNAKYATLNDYLKANPRDAVASKVQELLSSSKSYEDFQSNLSKYYSTLTNNADKDYIYSISTAMSIIDQNAANFSNRSASCSGWWSCWGQCAGSILGGLLSGGLTGAATGSSLPVVGTVGGGIIGGVAGGIIGAVKGC